MTDWQPIEFIPDDLKKNHFFSLVRMVKMKTMLLLAIGRTKQLSFGKILMMTLVNVEKKILAGGIIQQQRVALFILLPIGNSFRSHQRCPHHDNAL